MPQQPQGQPAGQHPYRGQNHPQQATPWAPPPTQQLPQDQPITVVNTMEDAAGGATVPGGRPPQQRTVPGLGFVTFLLVVGTIAFAAFVAREWVVDWGTSVATCLDGGGAWECVSNNAGRTQVLLPVVAVLGSFSLARGAGVERQQGRGIGWLYALLGFGLVGFAWSMGAAA